MAPRVIIVHGWAGYPEEGWFPWLKTELEKRGIKTHVPQLPEAKWPQIKLWIPALAKTVGTTDEDTYFVGHSMGCQAIARYLETLPEGVEVGGAVFVAGFFQRLVDLDDDAASQAVEKEWLRTPVDLDAVRNHLPKSVAIFSDNDPWVPLDNQEDFRRRLGSTILVEHDMQHFSGEQGYRELPIVLEQLAGLMSS